MYMIEWYLPRVKIQYLYKIYIFCLPDIYSYIYLHRTSEAKVLTPRGKKKYFFFRDSYFQGTVEVIIRVLHYLNKRKMEFIFIFYYDEKKKLIFVVVFV